MITESQFFNDFDYPVLQYDAGDPSADQMIGVMFFHGLGEQGTDLVDIKKQGLPKHIEILEMKAMEHNKMVRVVCPQFTDMKRVGAYKIPQFINLMPISAKLNHCTGLSQGGILALKVLSVFGELFDQYSSVAGWLSENIKNPKHMSHADVYWTGYEKDPQVNQLINVERTEKYKPLVKSIDYDLIPGSVHGGWNDFYGDPDSKFYKMLFSEEVPVEVPPTSPTGDKYQQAIMQIKSILDNLESAV